MQTIELDGRPIAVMGGSREAVLSFAGEDAFRDDLLTFEDEDGRPLWDGAGTFAPQVRDARPAEAAAFERSFAEALARGSAEPEDRDDWLAFLVAVRDAIGGGAPP